MVEHQQTPILDQMEEQIYVRDLEMNLLFINRAAAALTGWSQSEARGRKCWEVFGDPGNTCRKVCPVDRAIAAKEPILHHEGVLETRSGAVRNMRVAISPLFDGDDVGDVVLAKRFEESLLAELGLSRRDGPSIVDEEHHERRRGEDGEHQGRRVPSQEIRHLRHRCARSA